MSFYFISFYFFQRSEQTHAGIIMQIFRQRSDFGRNYVTVDLARSSLKTSKSTELGEHCRCNLTFTPTSASIRSVLHTRLPFGQTHFAPETSIGYLNSHCQAYSIQRYNFTPDYFIVIVSRKASLGIIYYDGSVFFLPNWSVFYTLSSHRKFFIFMKCEKYNSRKIP